MGIVQRIGDNSSAHGVIGALVRMILRFFQFIIAITVAGLYGVDLHAAHQQGAGADGKWVYAEVVAGLSAFTVIVYGIPFIKSYWFWAWDIALFIGWTALFGVFGHIFINAHATPKQSGIHRMKNAVWVDLTGMLLWAITAFYSTFIWLRQRRNRTVHTGRAKV
jgi:hypothetical protein